MGRRWEALLIRMLKFAESMSILDLAMVMTPYPDNNSVAFLHGSSISLGGVKYLSWVHDPKWIDR